MNLPDDPRGWLMSEKLDGVFCRWTGSAFLSRNGHKFTPPAWWLDGMPKVMLDGELWNHRGGFDDLVSVIQRRKSEWDGVTFRVFDAAILKMPVEARISLVAGLPLPAHVIAHPHRRCLGNDDLDMTEKTVVRSGGEGVILREPGSTYRPGKFVKVKRLFPDLNRSILD